MSTAPPKPWENGNVNTDIQPQPQPQPQDSTQPAIPPRPSNLSNINPMYDNPYNQIQQPFTGGGMNGGIGAGVGSGMYGDSFGGGYGFGGPYSRFGNGMAGIGGFGGYNSGYNAGFGGLGYRPMAYGEPNSVGQRMESGTQATFQLLESIVGTFGGFAQMLESTFMATHSSFYAMLGVAEQFGHLKGYLAQILSAFNVLRWIKLMIAKARGRKLPERARDVQNKPKKKPLVIFLLAVIGVPYIMAKLVKMASQSQINQHLLIGSNGERIDPSNLTFVRCKYAYTPPEDRKGTEIEIKVGDIVAVINRSGEWIQGRTRDGRFGWIPNNFVDSIEK